MVKFPVKMARERAQELAYEAIEYMDYDHEDMAVDLCEEALKIYPDCVDAQMVLAEIESETVFDYIDALKQAVESGRRDLGEAAFKEDKGYFWGLIETRPFMNAMVMLAENYRLIGRYCVDEAIEILEEMLELNPNDNQGARYLLIDCYLAKKLYQKAAAMIKQYEDDTMAIFNWARVLYAYATEGEDAAEKAIKQAIKQNEYVLPYLCGKKRTPKYPPECYSSGDKAEAILCAITLKESWKRHREAKRWLKRKAEEL